MGEGSWPRWCDGGKWEGGVGEVGEAGWGRHGAGMVSVWCVGGELLSLIETEIRSTQHRNVDGFSLVLSVLPYSMLIMIADEHGYIYVYYYTQCKQHRSDDGLLLQKKYLSLWWW